jgi:hypothetical protein
VTSHPTPLRPGDLPALVFRALYPGHDLHVINGTYLVLPKGTSWHAGPSLGAIARQLSHYQHQPSSAGHAQAGLVTKLPPPGQGTQITGILDDQPGWSAFWDKRYGLWRVAEDDPDSDLYTEVADADTVIRYITAHS